jgi:hypothetical protein
VLRIARTGAVKSRTAAYNQLKDLIITAPDSLRETLRDKTLQRVALESARLRPDTNRLADPPKQRSSRCAPSLSASLHSTQRSPHSTRNSANW